jgi:hypothetical protein
MKPSPRLMVGPGMPSRSNLGPVIKISPNITQDNLSNILDMHFNLVIDMIKDFHEAPPLKHYIEKLLSVI